MRSELAQKQSQQLDAYLQALRNQLNSQRQREAEQALESTELLAENSDNLPVGIVEQFRINRELSQALNQQAQRMDLVASQQRRGLPGRRCRCAGRSIRCVNNPSGWAHQICSAKRCAHRLPVYRKCPNRSNWTPKWRSCACTACVTKIC